MNANLPPKTPKISAWLTRATDELKAAGIPTASLDSEIILAHTIKQPRTYLHAHSDDLLSRRDQEIADTRLQLRLDRVPIAYIIGHKEFYGRRLRVTTATLIPRPESEVMIDMLKELAAQTSLVATHPRLIDVGTGSGALGITAKLELPELDVTVADISRHALTVADANSKALDADVTIIHSDLLANYPFSAQYIVANLPYVDAQWPRSPETDHEPSLALFAADHGLALIKQLIASVPTKLSSHGWLLLEADPAQHTAISHYASKYGLQTVQTKDYILALQKTH